MMTKWGLYFECKARSMFEKNQYNSPCRQIKENLYDHLNSCSKKALIKFNIDS